MYIGTMFFFVEVQNVEVQKVDQQNVEYVRTYVDITNYPITSCGHLNTSGGCQDRVK
jgi:hypothetical protein